MNLKVITINLPEPYLDAIQVLNDHDVYPSRSKVIRVALRNYLSNELTFFKELTIDGVLCPNSDKNKRIFEAKEVIETDDKEESQAEETFEHQKQSAVSDGTRHYLYYSEITDLLKEGPKTDGELATLLEFPRTAVRGDLERLQDRGRVKKVHKKGTDGRRSFWKLTEKGVEIAA